MDRNFHVIPPPVKLTHLQLQALARQMPHAGKKARSEDIDYRSLFTAWAVAVGPRVNEPSSGYFYWLGGESIQYQPLRTQRNSS